MPDYPEHHPQRYGRHVAGRARPSFAPGWVGGPTASDGDAHGLLRGMMGAFTEPEEEDA